MKEESKLTILYTLNGIQPYTPIEGYVALLLSPFDNLNEPKRIPRKLPGNIKVMGMGRQGPIPAEDMQEMQQQIEHVMENLTGMHRKNHDDDRDIIIIEPKEDYQKRNWNYGALIEATFVKVEDKQEKPEEERTEQ